MAPTPREDPGPNAFLTPDQLASEGRKPPEFGHPMRVYFPLDPTYVNLNNGSFGLLPLPVHAACDAWTREIESNPDLFLLRKCAAHLTAVRTRLAKLLGAQPDECVLVPGAGHGLNTVLQNFEWAKGDVIIRTTTSYNAVSRLTQYLSDQPPHPTLSTFPLLFPISHSDILSNFRAHLRSIPRRSDTPPQKIVAVIDSIVARPGALLPWRQLVQICREEGVWSVVDAAHSIGQEVDIDLGKAQPDFWVSNCHKWLYAKRSCAVLYVPKRHQHLIKSTFPVSYAYVSPTDDQAPRPDSFLAQFEWTGTADFVPYLSVGAALDFREWLGGEEKINRYCHDLAVAGGQRLAWVVRGCVMEGEEIVANMVNVELPIPGKKIPWSEEVDEVFRHQLLEEWGVYAVHFYHNEKWWVRCSAQVWNHIKDFDVLGRALLGVCKEIREKFGTKTGESKL